MPTEIITPGMGPLCILNHGQLGLMSANAAHRLGFETLVWGQDTVPDQMDPAMKIATYRERSPFDNKDSQDAVARNCKVATIEWENTPIAVLRLLQKRGVMTRPNINVLMAAQNRSEEKHLAAKMAIPTTNHSFLAQNTYIARGAYNHLFPGILKTNRNGYDGKGQILVRSHDELNDAWTELGHVECLLEKWIDLKAEYSIAVFRNASGHVTVSDVVKNTHKKGILDTTVWRSNLVPYKVTEALETWAKLFAAHLELEGMLVLEFFLDQDDNLYFNEMAPRPHNSFHGSIDTAPHSQFELHIRAICNMPLFDLRHERAFTMTNFVGHTWEEAAAICADVPNALLHWYGKSEARPGRKMGHMTTFD